MRDYHFHNDHPLAAHFPALPIVLEQIIVGNDTPPFHDVALFLPLAIALTTAVHHTHRAILVHGRITPAIFLLEATQPTIRMHLLLPDDATTAESQPRLPYIAPEQTGRTNHPVDHRADLYALGVIFYQLLTGQLPFPTADPAGIIHAHAATNPLPPTALHPTLPGPLSNIILKLLAKEPQDRYQSAEGLLADLERCQQQWQNQQTITPFPLGEQDISARLLLSEKMYGRHPELSQLHTALATNMRDGQLWLVAGDLGMGKTTFVTAVREPARQGGIRWLSYRAEATTPDVPYAAALGVLKDFTQQILAQEPLQRASWQERLTAALAGNVTQLLRHIPELGLLLPTPPDLPDGGASDTHFILTAALQVCLKTIAAASSSLLIFIDDAHQADADSLRMLHELQQQQPFLLIWAYRAVPAPTGYLAETAAALPASNKITLAPLTLDDYAHFLADVLHATTTAVVPLAQLLHAKTNGNPFFLRQLLRLLSEQTLIHFDPQLRAWCWDLTRLQAAPLADNVVELVRDQLQQLPETTQHLLKAAAVMETPFSATWLAIICERPLPETEQAVWRCLTLGVFTPLADTTTVFSTVPAGPRAMAMHQVTARYMAAPGEPKAGRANSGNVSGNPALQLYQFAHEELRVAARLLLPTVDEAVLHYQIGGRLWQSMTPVQRRSHSALLIRHFNQATAVPLTESDTAVPATAIAMLHLQASRNALGLSVYGNSLALAQRGITWLDGENGWQNAPSLMGDLHLTAARAAARLGQFAHSQRLLDTMAQAVLPSEVQDALVQEQMVIAYLQGNHEAAVRTALTALRELGIHLPLQPNKFHLALALLRTKVGLGRRPLARLSSLQPMTAVNSLRALAIMAAATISIATFNPNLLILVGLEIVRQTLKQGAHPLSALGYALYGVLCCGVTGQTARGVAFGEMALTLIPQIEDKEYRVFVKYFVHAHVQHWQKPMVETLQPLRDLSVTGEFEYLALAAGLYPYFTWFINGSDIGQNERAIAESMPLLASFEGTPLYFRYQLGRQYYQNLLGLAEDPCQLVGGIYDERDLLPFHQAQNDRATVFYLACHKLTLGYLFGDYEQGRAAAQLATAYRDGGVGTPLIPVLNFYDSLTRLALFPGTAGRAAHQLWQGVAANQRKMARWAQHGPANCAHRYSLVAAEMARLRGENGRARELYDTAVRQARTYDYLPELPLAHELAARFYLGLEQPAYAEHHLRQAHSHYRRWGATGKTQQLERLYPQLFPRAPLDGPTNLADLSAYLDMAAVFKATQLLSGETGLPQLLTKLTLILTENAGAQTGCLLLLEGGQWRTVSRQPEAGQDEEQQEATAVPLSLVWQVARTSEPILLHDVATAVAYAHDPYLQAARPRSALCLPLLDKGELVGVFYLENRLTRHAFAADRIPLLMALANQAAISLRNALLLTGLQEARQSIETSERRFRLMFENAPLGVLEIDITTVPLKIRAANRRAEALYGWSAAELAALTPVLLVPEGSRPEIEQLVVTVRQGQTAVLETTNQRRDGTVFPVRIIATPADVADGRYMIIAVEDMTAQQARRSEIQAIEDERRRIAQEIHDGVAQDLAFLRLKLALWRDWVHSDPDQMQSELDHTEKTLDATIQEIRRSIYALRPLALGEIDFLPALQRYIADFNEQQQDTYVTLHVDLADEPLPADLELPLFRVIQEGLNNIAQHARASLAWVELAVSGDRGVALTVRDNGRGFDVAAVAENGRLGLLQMRERVETAGGHLTVTSQPGQGTKILVRLPWT